MVRLEALRGFAARRDDGACDAFVAATRDAEPHVALLALDQLAACGGSRPDASTLLESHRQRSVERGAPRGWHRAAHALVALAAAAPDRATRGRCGQFAGSTAVAAAHVCGARGGDAAGSRAARGARRRRHDNVVEAAIDGLSQVAGHDADDVYVQALARPGYQAIRAAALALDGTPKADDSRAGAAGGAGSGCPTRTAPTRTTRGRRSPRR